MADLSADSRGQLLLVTGFALAVAIVALVLLLNTSIFMENLSTRGVDAGEDAALEYRNTVKGNLWPLVEAENDREHASRSTLENNVSDRIDQFTMLSARRHLDGGASANVSNVTLHEGTRVVQTNESRDLTDASGAKANWTMVEGVEDVRTFEVNTTGLHQTDVAEDDAFRIDVVGNNGSGNRWSVYVYEDLVGDSHVEVKNGTESLPTEVCPSLLSGPPELNLTAGTINGSDCAALEFGKGATPPYRISVTYGNHSTGTYDATANGTPPGAGNFNEPTTSPYEVPVVYNASLDVEYRSPTLTYRARIHLPEGTA